MRHEMKVKESQFWKTSNKGMKREILDGEEIVTFSKNSYSWKNFNYSKILNSNSSRQSKSQRLRYKFYGTLVKKKLFSHKALQRKKRATYKFNFC
jgi:hypothetical protein